MALEENTSAESGISRRTIVKGAAWAAPVMIAAVAVPAAVASPHTISPTTQIVGNVQTTTTAFTLAPSVAAATLVSLATTSPGWLIKQSAGSTGLQTGSATVVAGSKFSFIVVPGTSNDGMFTVSGGSGNNAWSTSIVLYKEQNKTLVNPPTLKQGSGTYTLNFSPAAAAGSVYSLALTTTAGTAATFGASGSATTLQWTAGTTFVVKIANRSSGYLKVESGPGIPAAGLEISFSG